MSTQQGAHWYSAALITGQLEERGPVGAKHFVLSVDPRCWKRMRSTVRERIDSLIEVRLGSWAGSMLERGSKQAWRSKQARWEGVEGGRKLKKPDPT